jgi:hypothetical protein
MCSPLSGRVPSPQVRRIHPEPELVEDAAQDEVAPELAAAGEEQVAIVLVLQFSHSLHGVALDHRRVPLERAVERARRDI